MMKKGIVTVGGSPFFVTEINFELVVSLETGLGEFFK
jgi:hypothetical protein